MVPPKAFDGDIKVSIESADGTASPIEYEFEKRFQYVAQTSVGTLVGNEDEQGNSSDVDGDFEKARFGNTEWLLMDTFGIQKCLIVNGFKGPIRRINLETQEVSTLMTEGQGLFGECTTCALMRQEILCLYQMTTDKITKIEEKLLTCYVQKTSGEQDPMSTIAQDIAVLINH